MSARLAVAVDVHRVIAEDAQWCDVVHGLAPASRAVALAHGLVHGSILTRRGRDREVCLEAGLLLWIHAQANPVLDAAAIVSHVLGTLWFCAPLVVSMAVLHAWRGERTWAWVWLALGSSTFILQECLKQLAGRTRPDLWPRLVSENSFSFPSGHALASATLYPLLAWHLARHVRNPWLPWLIGLGLPLFIGGGRLYLGVHWPTDVLAGWTLGAAQFWLATEWLERGRPRGPAPQA